MGIRGRSLKSAPGVGGTTFVAHLQCARCPTNGERRLRAMMPPDQIDRKFAQAGWQVDPHVCPDCRAKSKEKPVVATKPTAAAMKAQANMFTLLNQHFDPDAGAYAADWNDQRVATESGLAVDHVTEFRRAGFGEIKEPPEIRVLRAEINDLDKMAKEWAASIVEDIAKLRASIAKISGRYAS